MKRIGCRLPAAFFVAWLAAGAVGRALPGDVEGASDYPDFPRLPGFVISDYDEDNPSAYDFPVAHPLPDDSGHVETLHIRGHRLVIRYEMEEGGHPLVILQIQQAYEKMAAASGYLPQKTGAVGDVSETFCRQRGTQQIWAHLEPSGTAIVLTVVETKAGPAEKPSAPAVAANPAPPPAGSPEDDPIYTALMTSGRVVVPLTFLPSRPDLDAESQPMIDRIARIMVLHPDLLIRIDGHTDKTADSTADLRLSSARAHTVATLLVTDGIERSRLEPVGFGGTVPLASNDTAEGRELNRRIEIVLKKN